MSRALRAVEQDLIEAGGPVLVAARESGNWRGAVQQVYAHQLETGWLPPRLTVTGGQIGAELEMLREHLADLRVYNCGGRFG